MVSLPVLSYARLKITNIFLEFKCATCSGAISDIQRQGLKFAVGMALITILSFTWFVGGAGLLYT
jgi:hypothetical protein